MNWKKGYRYYKVKKYLVKVCQFKYFTEAELMSNEIGYLIKEVFKQMKEQSGSY